MFNIKNRIRPSLESASVLIIMLFVFLPIRLLFVKYISPNWIGSFGLITVISIIILILAKKDKLSWFGRAYLKQLYKANRGRRKYIFYFALISTTLYLSAVIYAINVGQSDPIIQSKVKIVTEELHYKDINELTNGLNDGFKIGDIPKGLLLFIYIIFFRFDVFTILMSYINTLTNGWILHFSTVFFIEELEVIGLMVLYRFVIKIPKS